MIEHFTPKTIWKGKLIFVEAALVARFEQKVFISGEITGYSSSRKVVEVLINGNIFYFNMDQIYDKIEGQTIFYEVSSK